MKYIYIYNIHVEVVEVLQSIRFQSGILKKKIVVEGLFDNHRKKDLGLKINSSAKFRVLR